MFRPGAGGGFGDFFNFEQNRNGDHDNGHGREYGSPYGNHFGNTVGDSSGNVFYNGLHVVNVFPNATSVQFLIPGFPTTLHHLYPFAQHYPTPGPLRVSHYHQQPGAPAPKRAKYRHEGLSLEQSVDNCREPREQFPHQDKLVKIEPDDIKHLMSETTADDELKHPETHIAGEVDEQLRQDAPKHILIERTHTIEQPADYIDLQRKKPPTTARDHDNVLHSQVPPASPTAAPSLPTIDKQRLIDDDGITDEILHALADASDLMIELDDGDSSCPDPPRHRRSCSSASLATVDGGHPVSTQPATHCHQKY